MKKLVLIFTLLFSIMAFSQNFYETKWKTIAQNDEKGLHKSNLPIILNIQEMAKKEKNTIELMRSLKAEFSIINRAEEDSKNEINSQFFAKLNNIEKTLRSEDQIFFEVMKGEFVYQYLAVNNWQINDRTNVDNGPESKMEQWSILDFKSYFLKFYDNLNSKKSQLQNIQLIKYAKVFEKTDQISYFITLQDWVSIKDIQFLQNSQIFTTNELKKNQDKIELLYDGLIKNNTGNARLYFQHQKINNDCDFNNCTDRTEQLTKIIEDKSNNGDYKVLIIEDVINSLSEKKDYKKAIIWATKAKEEFPKSKFLNNILNRENQIKKPSLNLQFEQNTIPDQFIHLVVEARNTTKFSLKIFRIDDDIEGFIKYSNQQKDKEIYKLVKKNFVREENFVLPDFSDYKEHTTSLEIKPLPVGIYIVEYQKEKDQIENFYFIVSQSRIIYETMKFDLRKPDIFKIVNSNTGEIIPNEKLAFYEFFYDKKDVIKSFGKTDDNGNFKFPQFSDSDQRNFIVHQISSNDFQFKTIFAFDNDERNSLNNNEIDKDKYSAQIFTDRAIYRPGQIVYFKVINTQLIGEKESVNANLFQEILLMDANDDEVSRQKFTTNEFGSYNGLFALPKGKLNGTFKLKIKDDKIDNYAYFSVEEYKRPKFEVEFFPIKEEYKYGQTIYLKGTVKMYSGVALSNTTVKYEIKKQDIRYEYFSWLPRTRDNENSILGEVKTDNKGEFTIELKLEKNENVIGIQIDNYKINASVTDLNGETQVADTNLKVSSVSHFITIKNDEKWNYFADEDIKLEVQTKNYNDQILKKPFHVKLSSIKPDERIFRSNFENEIQDAPIFSKQEFIQKFPYDYFSKEEKKEEVTKIISNKIEQNETLNLGKLSAGKYELELYNIEGKDTIKTQKIFEVFDKKMLAKTQKPFLTILPERTEYSRNDTGKIYIYSAVPNAVVNIFLQNDKGESSVDRKQVKNGILIYDVIFPKDETIFSIKIQVQLVAFNDVKTEILELQIKSDLKPLQIETVVFRDKLLPGKKENWTVKIVGNNKEKVQAEFLVNMYDQSLDLFRKHEYRMSNLGTFFDNYSNFRVDNRLSQKYYLDNIEILKTIDVDYLNFYWFKNVNYYYYNRYNSGLPMLSQGGDNLIDIVNYGRMPTETEIKEYTDIMPDLSKIKVRENLNETAFFYPNLITDKDGNINFEFTSPEALTQWKVMFLAHTKEARIAYLEKEVITQKEFSVTPNYPRFLREGDEMILQSKLSSLVNKPLNGTAQLQILDAFTNEDISGKFNINDIQKSFELKENGNSVVKWNVKVPKDVSTIIIKVVAKAGDFSDGEQKAIAVLPNRMLVTDTVPIFVKEGQTKTFTLENLATNNSKTVQNFSNTLELTTNPMWEIMFDLPSLKTDDNQSADVIFNKWFADIVASEIFKANPKLKTIFEEYQSKALLNSNLEKNQELKQLLLEETPWVLESKNEEEQMQRLARLFEVNSMKNSIQTDWKELAQLQNGDGGFSWYKGYQSSYYNSLYILKNLGKLNVWLKGNTADYQNAEQKKMISKLIGYVDNEVHKYWDVSTSLNASKKNVVNNYVLDYLDTRNYWEKEYPLSQKGKTLKNAVIAKAKTEKITDFTFFGLHRLALLFNDYGEKEISIKFLTYLKETSTDTENQGVYWKQNLNDWGWYSSTTINHAGAFEAFQKLTPNIIQFIEEMKIWLITQKEVNSWGNSRTTAEVIFTILNSGKSWTSAESDQAKIIWGGKELLNSDTNATGYVKSTIKSENLDKNLGSVTITKRGAGIVQGGLYWQYFEELDKIKSSESYISITKELYKKVKTVNGEELQKISEISPLKIGDKVSVRMILNTDRNMEYIHLKDMRAAGFEPLNVISGYEWKNNLGYYQSTKDASTNFYIQNMPKGKYVFEYDYICNAAGTFSNGITTLQNYYAPQMNAHSTGTTVQISE